MKRERNESFERIVGIDGTENVFSDSGTVGIPKLTVGADGYRQSMFARLTNHATARSLLEILAHAEVRPSTTRLITFHRVSASIPQPFKTKLPDTRCSGNKTNFS